MKKCKICRKKTHLRFDCKCGLKKLCLTCLHDHECTFDHQKESAKQLKKDNPKIEFKKLNKL